MKVLHNANIFYEGGNLKGYLVIDGGKIKKVEKGEFNKNAKNALLSNKKKQDESKNFSKNGEIETIDCEEGLLIPGFIDVHVHLRDFQQSYKETILTGTKAALSGGTTTILAMPNTKPPLTSPKIIQEYKEIEKRYQLRSSEASKREGNKSKPYCNVGIIASIKKGFSYEDLDRLKDMGIFGLKIYPKDSQLKVPLSWDEKWKIDIPAEKFISDVEIIVEKIQKDLGMSQQKHQRLRHSSKSHQAYSGWKELFKQAKKYEMPLFFHPELITSSESMNPQSEEKANEEPVRDSSNELDQVNNINNKKLYYHNLAHPIKGDERAFLQKIIILIRSYFPEPHDAPHIHFCHVSSSKCIKMIQQTLKEEGYPCSIEVTPHHIFLNHQSNFPQQSLGKVLVPLRDPKTQHALYELLNTQFIDIIGTDHAPHTLEEKTKNGFDQAPSGLPYIDFAPRLLLNEVFSFNLPLDRIIWMYSTAPAKLFGLKHKGKIKEGYDADLVLVKKVQSYSISAKESNSKQKWNPFEGQKINAKIDKVFLKGIISYDNSNNHIIPSGGFIKPEF